MLDAKLITSSRNVSAEPTSRKTGGSLSKLVARAGAAYSMTSGPPRAVPSKRTPPEFVAGPVPGIGTRHLNCGRAVVAVVEHGCHEQKTDGRRPAAVAGQEGHRRGKPTPSALPHDNDPRTVNAEVIGSPLQSPIALLNWPRIRRFRSEAVLDRDHGQPKNLGGVKYLRQALTPVSHTMPPP